MPIGYKYAGREADSYINWAKIGTDMSSMIAKENKDRDDKKEALDQALRKDIDTLANAPMGENKDGNQVLANFSSNGTEFLKMIDKEFKAGRLSLKDYLHKKQNLMDGTNTLFETMKSIQADWSEKMKRKKDGESDVSEWDLAASIEGFGDIKNSDVYINPINGMLSVAKTKTEKINGKDVTVIDSDPSKYLTVNELRNYSKMKIDKFKMSTIDADVKNVGEKVSSIMNQGTLTKLGSISKVTDPNLVSKLNPDQKAEVANFTKYVDDLANVHVDGDPFAAASILRSYMGSNPKTNKVYGMQLVNTMPDKPDPNTVYFQKNSNGTITPILQEEQKEAARDFIKRKIYNQIDQKQEISATQYRPYPPQQTSVGYQREIDKGEAINVAKNVANILTGTDPEALGSLGYFKSGQNPAFVEKDGSKVTIYDKSGNPVTFDPSSERQRKEAVRRIVRGLNTTGLNEDDIVKIAMEEIGNKPFTKSNRKIGYAWKGVSETEGSAADAVRKMSYKTFKNSQTSVVDDLTNSLSQFGVTVSPTGTGLNNYVSINYKGYNKTGIPVNLYTDAGASDVREDIARWMQTIDKQLEQKKSGQTSTEEQIP